LRKKTCGKTMNAKGSQHQDGIFVAPEYDDLEEAGNIWRRNKEEARGRRELPYH